MKRLTLLTVAIVLTAAVNLWAAEARPNPNPIGVSGAALGFLGQPGQAKSPAQWYIESFDPVVGLTDQQKKAITEVIESRDKTMQEFQSKNAEKLSATSKAIGEAYRKNDKEAIAKAQKLYQEAYAPIHQAMKESQKKLDEILTPQQKEKQADHWAAIWIKAMTDPIELSEEQKQKAKAAFREMQKGLGNELRGRFGPPDAILKILTPEQRTALNKHRLGSYVKAIFARIKLTDEQNKKVEALLDKVCQEPNLNVDWKLNQSVSQKVEELLTAEQKETLKKPLGAWGQAGGGVGGFGGFGGSYNPGTPLNPMPGKVGQYWIGLTADQGLVVKFVAPESPAAKAHIKSDDVILKAGDRAMKTVQDLLQAIEQAKEKDLVLEILRDGKKQKITVKPAKRPAEGVFVLQLEEGKGEKSSSGAKVRQLRGGGLQVIIGEANEGAEGKAAVRSLEAARKELEKTLATAHAKAGERIKRQHELAEKVWQAYQKMQALGENKKGEAHELWEQIENLERQLRQTFEPAGGALRPVAPGAPLNRVPNPAPGAPLNLSNGWIQIVPGGQLAPGQSAPGQPLPGGNGDRWRAPAGGVAAGTPRPGGTTPLVG